MLHLFLEKGPWFRAKSHGLGAGLPFKWQGWALLTAHIGTVTGLSFALAQRPVVMVIACIIAALAPFPIYAARTEGGWRWRWGEDDKPDDKKAHSRK